jgi:hypothetical protein
MNTFSKLAFIGVLLLGAAPWSASWAEGDSPHEQGVWEKHEYTFQFLGFTTTYSCEGLADKLKLLLIAAGARPDVKANASGCSRGFGTPDKFARANLTFYALRIVAADKPSDSPPVAARWKPIDIANRSPQELEVGDCELVEQFRDHLLPLFTTSSVEDHITCVPHQESGSSFSLKFESLVAVPPKKPPN